MVWRRGGAERRIEEEEGWRGGREEGERRRGRGEERKKGVEGEGEVRGGGGVQQQKRSCRREKPRMSFVFFVLFCSFLKHL